jgi:hypothetical protein
MIYDGNNSTNGYPRHARRGTTDIYQPRYLLCFSRLYEISVLNHYLCLCIGQFYTITLNDTEAIDGEIESTIILMFHDDQQRRVATSFWRFWLGQQSTATSVRAIDIGKFTE